MTKQDYGIIMGYYNENGMDRRELEKTLHFDSLTMDNEVAKSISERLKDAGYKKAEAERAMQQFVRYVKARSGSGEITWDEFIDRLNELALENSEFGIRAQRFSNYSYWEVWFNHYDIKDCENGKSIITFNHEYYDESEREKAYETLENNYIDTESDANKVIEQIAHKWDEMSNEERDDVISALYAIHATQYVDRSRMNIDNDMIEKITMTNADLLPEMGLRDYGIWFTNGDSIFLRF